MEFCNSQRILILTYPPHSTHSLQPLDVGIFGPLSTRYSNELDKFMHACEGLSSISKRDFFRLFWQAWGDTMSSGNIESAWKKTGIIPYNPEVVLKRFNKAPEQRPSTSDSSRSVLQADDWRRIERLLKDVVSDFHDKNTKKLSATIHELATKNSLLELRCEGLQAALKNEKKKRNRGKALQFPPVENSHGGAVFYSPMKIQAARTAMAEKAKEAELAKAAKEEKKLQQQQRKEAKQQLLEQRKRNRAADREMKLLLQEQKKQAKEEERLAKEAARQLQNTMKSIQTPKKKTPRASKDQICTMAETPAPPTVDEVPPTTTKAGRAIRLPTRFREF
jgi:hypothetical protein